MQHVVRRFHQATKHPANPVIVPDKPWERSIGHNFGTVFYEDGKFRFWYQISAFPEDFIPEAMGTFHCAYAESIDGIYWSKPDLSLVKLRDSEANNIVASDIGWINIIKDEHDLDPSRRYKMLYFGPGKEKPGTVKGWMDKKGHWGWCVAFSQDRFHWQLHPDNPVYTGASDAGTLFGWDEEQRKYVAYLIPQRVPYERTVGRTTSDDFIHWGPTKTIITRDEFDPPATEFYPMTVLRYQEWFIGMVYMLYCDPKDPIIRAKGLMDIQLAASRDGIKWTRIGGRQPFIPRGERGNWDMGMVGPNNGLIEKNDKLWFYYNGWAGEHWETKAYRRGRSKNPGLFEMGRLSSGIGLAQLRQDGFVSIDAGEDEGSLTTPFETLSKGDLVINATTTPGGYIAAEILSLSGTPIEGYSSKECERFSGDSMQHVMTWQEKGLSQLKRGEYAIRFLMCNASLYSYSL